MIFGGGPFGIWFLGFVRGGEFRWSADFQLIPARDQPLASVHSSSSSLRQISPAAGMQFLVAAISCLSERVLHLP